MTRLYFKDPVQALWMMKEFGVKILYPLSEWEKEMGSPTLFFTYGSLLGKMLSFQTPDKLYIAKESEHIFEPKEGDIVKVEEFFEEKQDSIVEVFETGDCRQYFVVDRIGYNIEPSKTQIIMRNNKHFFNPLIENNY